MIGGVHWHLPNRKVTFLRSAFLLVEPLKQISLDLIARRIFFLQVEYAIFNESKEIRTPGQNDFILKIVCPLFCKY